MVDENKPSQGWLSKIENPWKLLALALVLTQVVTLYFLFSGTSATGLIPLPNANSNGKVTVVAYEDFQCPFCTKFETETYPQLKKDYIDTGKIEFQYKHFPLSQIHSNAQIASEASECARDQGKFEEYKTVLFQQQSDWAGQSDPTGKFGAYATQLGMDGAKLIECAKSGSKTAIVAKDAAEGAQLGVTGTPTFYINGKQLVGAQPYSAFQQAIADAGGSSGTIAPAKPEPEVRLTIVNDSACATCDSSAAESLLKSRLFSNLKVEKVEFSSAKGQELYNSLQFDSLPAYLFDSSVEQSNNYAQIQAVLQKNGGTYVLNPSAVEVGKILAPIDVTGKHALGKENAPITIVEFSDFQCPYCGKFYTETEKQLVQAYVDSGKAKLVFLHFPLDSIHPLARPASEASECAAEQGKFWEFHNIAFEQQSKLSESQLRVWAKDIGLDETKFNDCYGSGKFKQLVQDDQDLGIALGVSGTPAFYINGMHLNGAQPFSEFQRVVESASAKN